jgi:hypothetical protein
MGVPGGTEACEGSMAALVVSTTLWLPDALTYGDGAASVSAVQSLTAPPPAFTRYSSSVPCGGCGSHARRESNSVPRTRAWTVRCLTVRDAYPDGRGAT